MFELTSNPAQEIAKEFLRNPTCPQCRFWGKELNERRTDMYYHSVYQDVVDELPRQTIFRQFELKTDRLEVAPCLKYAPEKYYKVENNCRIYTSEMTFPMNNCFVISLDVLYEIYRTERDLQKQLALWAKMRREKKRELGLAPHQKLALPEHQLA